MKTEFLVNFHFNFYKADGARSRQSTGLGLSIAKGLVEKMGGQAAAKLEGEWFRVCVRFPLDGADRIETNERISKKRLTNTLTRDRV